MKWMPGPKPMASCGPWMGRSWERTSRRLSVFRLPLPRFSPSPRSAAQQPPPPFRYRKENYQNHQRQQTARPRGEQKIAYLAGCRRVVEQIGVFSSIARIVDEKRVFEQVRRRVSTRCLVQSVVLEEGRVTNGRGPRELVSMGDSSSVARRDWSRRNGTAALLLSSFRTGPLDFHNLGSDGPCPWLDGHQWQLPPLVGNRRGRKWL